MIGGQASGAVRNVGQDGDAHVSPEVKEILKVLRSFEGRQPGSGSSQSKSSNS
jgi:hypothetical protein